LEEHKINNKTEVRNFRQNVIDIQVYSDATIPGTCTNLE